MGDPSSSRCQGAEMLANLTKFPNPNEPRKARYSDTDGRRERMFKACERCRMKKMRCDGDGRLPCRRCKNDGLVCSTVMRKKTKYKELSHGYAEVLDSTQFDLIASAHRLYAMVRDRQSSLLGEPEVSDRGQPIATNSQAIDSCSKLNRGPARIKTWGTPWAPDEDPRLSPSQPHNRLAAAAATNRSPSRLSGLIFHPYCRHLSRASDGPAESIKQPEARPASQEQLTTEVKGIYAGLAMVENKCIEVDSAQNSEMDHNPRAELEWQALIALHRTLLHEHHDFFVASQHPNANDPMFHEHHDFFLASQHPHANNPLSHAHHGFFLASQHPSACPALGRLASKYAMPARMWRHGIHDSLELLGHSLPASLEHMLSFIYPAYSMMALTYETVPSFEDTWIECLGDLGRYRMAIEDDNIRDQDVWTAGSHRWHSKASEVTPTMGRLYHRLAIFARLQVLLGVSVAIILMDDNFNTPTLHPGPHTMVADREWSRDDTFRRSCCTSTGGVRLGVIPPELRTRGRPTADDSPNDATAFGFGIRSSLLRWILSFLLPVAFLPLTLAEPCLDKWRIVKVMSVGASAMGSFATTVASLHLDIESVSKKTHPADLPLRIVATAFPLLLAGLYSLCFLTRAHKARSFLKGTFIGAMLCWLFIRLASSAGDDKADDSSFLWLDKVNLSACLSIIAGILNVERGLFNSLHERDDDTGSDNGDSGSNGSNGRETEDEDRPRIDERRRPRNRDPEDQAGYPLRSGGRRDQDSGASSGVVNAGVAGVIQAGLSG